MGILFSIRKLSDHDRYLTKSLGIPAFLRLPVEIIFIALPVFQLLGNNFGTYITVTCPTASDRNGMERCVVSCISRGLYRAVELWSCAPYLNSCPVAQILSPPPPTACNQPLSAHPHTFHINQAYTDGYIICVYIRV